VSELVSLLKNLRIKALANKRTTYNNLARTCSKNELQNPPPPPPQKKVQPMKEKKKKLKN